VCSSEAWGDPRLFSVTMPSVQTFVVGQYVELYPTIQSATGGSILSGTRGIVDEVDRSRPADDCYLVAFLSSELRTGERAWLRAADLVPA